MSGGAGFAIGLAIGVAVGIATDNLAFGIAIGVAIGLALGAVARQSKRKGDPADGERNTDRSRKGSGDGVYPADTGGKGKNVDHDGADSGDGGGDGGGGD